MPLKVAIHRLPAVISGCESHQSKNRRDSGGNPNGEKATPFNMFLLGALFFPSISQGMVLNTDRIQGRLKLRPIRVGHRLIQHNMHQTRGLLHVCACGARMLAECDFGDSADPCAIQGLTCTPGPVGYICGETFNA